MSPRAVSHLFALALTAFGLSATWAVEPLPAPGKWEKEVAAIEQRDGPRSETRGGIVFVGSSSIRLWKTLAEDFPKHRVLNHGFGGSMLSDAVQFADRLVLAFEPRFIVVYAGGNDLNAKRTAEEVFTSFQQFVAVVRERQPATPIAYISIAGNPKRWAQIDEVRKANRLIEEFIRSQPHLVYIDTFSAMLGADGLPRPEIFSADHLHMNAQGYRLWTEIVGRHLPPPDRP